MAEIQDQINAISDAEYGRDVRTAIVNALVAINQEVTTAIGTITGNVAAYEASVNSIVQSAEASINQINEASEAAERAVSSVNALNHLVMSVDFLSPGSRGEASFNASQGLLYFGIPYPEKGDTGASGQDGHHSYIHVKYSSSKAKPEGMAALESMENNYFSSVPVDVGYVPVSNPSVVDPYLQGYFEIRSMFKQTSDTSVVEGKSYYTPQGQSFVPVSDIPSGANPSELGYFNLDRQWYVASPDRTVNPLDTYYEYTGNQPNPYSVVVNPDEANPKKLGFFEYSLELQDYRRTDDTTVVQNKQYYREVGSEWIGIENSESPTASLFSDSYSWVKFRGPKGETGTGASSLVTQVDAALDRRVQMTLLKEYTYPDNTMRTSGFTSGTRTDETWKGYEALMIVFMHTDGTNFYTSTTGSLKNTNKKAKSLAACYTKVDAVASSATHPPYHNERIPLFVPAGNMWAAVTHVNASGVVSGRRVKYDASAGTIEYTAATVGTLSGDSAVHGTYYEANTPFKNASAKMTYGVTSSKPKGTTKSVSYKLRLDDSVRAKINHWIVPWRIYGIKGLT